MVPQPARAGQVPVPLRPHVRGEPLISVYIYRYILWRIKAGALIFVLFAVPSCFESCIELKAVKLDFDIYIEFSM